MADIGDDDSETAWERDWPNDLPPLTAEDLAGTSVVFVEAQFMSVEAARDDPACDIDERE